MKKINKENFLKIFNYENIIDKSICDDVSEFTINNKYFYKLNSESPFFSTHNKLCFNFLNNIPLNNSAIAYRSGISYLNLFEPHRSGYYFLRLDISSFFHSIKEESLKSCFSKYFENEHIDKGKKKSILDTFISSVTYKVPDDSPNERFRKKIILPIGFKTSPVISNIIFRRLDILIQKYCSSKNIAYSRYSDDMLFSSPFSSSFLHSESFIREIKYLLSIDGFKINKKKTIKAKHTLSLNGYVISNKDSNSQNAYIHISNKKTKIIEKMIYMLKNNKTELEILVKIFGLTRSNFKYPPDNNFLEQYCRDQLLNKLTGYRSFIISIIKFDNKYQCVNPLALDKYVHIIESLNKYIDKIDKKNNH